MLVLLFKMYCTFIVKFDVVIVQIQIMQNTYDTSVVPGESSTTSDKFKLRPPNSVVMGLVANCGWVQQLMCYSTNRVA